MGLDDLFFDISFWLDEVKSNIDIIKEIGDEFSNDIQIACREFDDDIREIIQDSTIGIPVLEQIVDIGYEIGDSTKTLLRTFSNPLSPQSGQLVESSQLDKADHIFVIRPLYTHHGIYVGNGKVIHYALDDSGNSSIFETTIDGFKNWTSPVDAIFETTFLYRFSKFSSPIKYSVDEVIRRAYSRVGETDYHLLFNNCEHFARWCRCNQPY